MSRRTMADIRYADDIVTPHAADLCLATLERNEVEMRRAKVLLVRAVSEAIAAARNGQRLSPTALNRETDQGERREP